jgi:hypothetical protein
VNASPDSARAVVLVEGHSDRAALETLARRCGLDADREGVAIVPIGGATNISRYVEQYGPRGRNIDIGGLCDAGEEPALRRRLARVGLGVATTRHELEQLGFFVCDRDLEDEMIRALGIEAVEGVVESEGELASLRIMQAQPAQRERSPADQLHRFIGTRSGRKIRYGRLLAEALDPQRVPPPLAGVVDWMSARLPS